MIDTDSKLSNKSNPCEGYPKKPCVVESKSIEANKNNRSRRSLPWRKVGYKEERRYGEEEGEWAGKEEGREVRSS
jgi:hypothetical protein